jgi:hypothetical protein
VKCKDRNDQKLHLFCFDGRRIDVQSARKKQLGLGNVREMLSLQDTKVDQRPQVATVNLNRNAKLEKFQ